MYQNKKKQLQQCWQCLSKFICIKNTFDLGSLSKICSIILIQSNQSAYELSSQNINANTNNNNNTNNNSNTSNNKNSNNNNNTNNTINDLVKSVIDFITIITEKARKDQLFSSQYIALIAIDSVLFNIYAKAKNTDKLRLNNSFYNSMSMSMSMSQMSDQLSQQMSGFANNIEQLPDLKLVVSFIQALSINSDFFKKLKLIYDRSHHKANNHHYLQNLMETMDYILAKQKVKSKQTFSKQRQQNFPNGFVQSNHNQIQRQSINQMIKKDLNDHVSQVLSIQDVNSVIFSDQLNKIVFLLESSNDDSLYFSLHRVYFVGRQRPDQKQRKHFKNLRFSTADMNYNLFRLYIQSFDNKSNLFQSSKNPLYMFISTYLQTFFMPVWTDFCSIISVFAKGSWKDIIQFYKDNQSLLQKYISNCIQSLPTELIEFLNMVLKIIQKHFNLGSMNSHGLNQKKQSYNSISSLSNQGMEVCKQNYNSQKQNQNSSMSSIKRLLIYSFLASPQLLKKLYLNNSLSIGSSIQKFQQTLNLVINLFFTSSIKKYSNNYSSTQLSSLLRLSSSIEAKLQDKISNFDSYNIDHVVSDDDPFTLTSYFVEEPILNHDYHLLMDKLRQIQFTPKDMKSYPMRKNNQKIYFEKGLKQIYFQKGVKQILDSPTIKEANLVQRNNKSSDNVIKMSQYSSQQFINFVTQQETQREGQSMSSSFVQALAQQNSKFNLYPQLNYQNNDRLDFTQKLTYVQEDNQNLDLLTWMTVGGTHNYKDKITVKSNRVLSKTGILGHTQDFSKLVQPLNQTNTLSNRFDRKKPLFFHHTLFNPPLTRHLSYQINKVTQQKEQNNFNESKDNFHSIRQQNVIKNQRRQKRQFKTFNSAKVKQINNLYQAYRSKSYLY